MVKKKSLFPVRASARVQANGSEDQQNRKKKRANNNNNNNNSATSQSNNRRSIIASILRKKHHRNSNNKDRNELDRICSATERSSRTFRLPKGSSRKYKEDNGLTSPQEFLDFTLKSLGYSTDRYSTLETGYYAKPTELQKASYHPYIIRLALEGKHEEFKEVMMSGISPNPCNMRGESLINMVCHSGELETFQILADASNRVGTSVQVSDENGRTPLHDACWRDQPCFEMIEDIARKDLHLFYMMDRHGATPLDYVPREQWNEWLEFLESKKSMWSSLVEASKDREAKLADMPPNMFPVKTPKNVLPHELVSMVASGKISPKEAHFLHMDAELSETSFRDSGNTTKASELYADFSTEFSISSAGVPLGDQSRDPLGIGF